MPRFAYHAYDQQGELRSGEYDAPNLRAARTALTELGLKVFFIERAIGLAAHRDASVVPGSVLSDHDFLDVSESVGDIVSSELPLESGLRALAEETPSRQTSAALRSLAGRVERGESWEAVSAGARDARSFPPVLRELLQSGLPPQELGSVLTRALDDLRQAADLRWRVWIGLLYSGLLLCALFVVVLLYLIFIMPQFAAMFLGFGAELPRLTQAVIDVSDWLSASPLGLVVGIVLVIVVGYALSHAIAPVTRARLFRTIPLVGTAYRSIALASFVQLLSLGIERRLSLVSALRLAGAASRDAELEAGSRSLATKIEQGQPLAQAVETQLEFPRSVINVCRFSGRPEIFSEALRSLGNSYEGEALTRASLAAMLSEPLVFVLILSSISVLLTATYLPLIQLLNDLS